MADNKDIDQNMHDPDTDLTGMNPETAQNYVLGFLKNLKEIQKAIEENNKNKVLWEERIKLAKDNNKHDLALKGEEELKKVLDKITKLQVEESGLKSKIPVLKEQLNYILNTFQYNQELDNANYLLEQLKMITGGDTGEIDKFLKDKKIQEEIENIKNKLKKE